jgi:hypothetical protein
MKKNSERWFVLWALEWRFNFVPKVIVGKNEVNHARRQVDNVRPESATKAVRPSAKVVDRLQAITRRSERTHQRKGLTSCTFSLAQYGVT